MFDFSIVTQWVDTLLRSWMSPTAAVIVECVLVGVCLLLGYAVIALALIYIERKVCAFFQCRLGPNRVGPYGVIQSVADMFKMLIKEIIHTKGLRVLDFNIGIFFLLAVSSIGIVGILLAGWSSNNKYTLIGAMRSGAQMISYELSIGLSILTMVMLAGTMSLSGIVEAQAGGWFIFTGHIPAIIAFLIYIIAGTAETNRGPFDLPEAESELTAGYHTEYSGMHFGFFYLAEYLNMFIVASVAATLFWGGWMPLHISGWDGFNQAMDYIPSIIWFLGKVAVMIFIIMWFKWTFPRLRIDQLLKLEWKYLLPINLINLLLMALIIVFGLHF